MTTKRLLPILLAGLLASCLAFRWIWWVGLGHTGEFGALLPFNSLDALAFGAALALIPQSAHGRISPVLAIVGVLGFVVYLTVQIAETSGANTGVVALVSNLQLGLTGIAAFFAWLVLKASVGIRGLAGGLLGNPAMVHLGRISYGVYAIHLPLQVALVDNFSLDVAAPSTALLCVLLTITLAEFSWRYFEQPIRRWGRSLAWHGSQGQGLRAQ